MERFINWLVFSSANPQKTGITVKAALVATIPVFIFLGRTLGVDIAESDLTAFIDAIALAVSSVLLVIGLGRKLLVQYVPPTRKYLVKKTLKTEN